MSVSLLPLKLTPAAWVIIMIAAATYCALASSYLLARPALQSFRLQADLLLLQSETDRDPRAQAIRDRAIKDLKERLRRRIPPDDRSNRYGRILLVMSFLLFSLAVLVQLATDPAFRG